MKGNGEEADEARRGHGCAVPLTTERRGCADLASGDSDGLRTRELIPRGCPLLLVLPRVTRVGE
jgi:hypothetical protein